MEGDGAAVSCNGRLFHKRAAATGNDLSPTVDWTDEYVERSQTLMRQNVVVVWLQCLLVDVVRHTGTLAPDHVDKCLPHVDVPSVTSF